MALNIVKATELTVDHLLVIIYGRESTGKTSLALTASKPLLIDFDEGAHRAGHREDKDVLPVTSWRDLAGMDHEDVAEYDTIIVDTFGTCLDKLAQHLMENDPKLSRGPGNLSLQGWGALKGSFHGWINFWRSCGKDLIFVAHLQETEKGGEPVDRIVAQGSSKNDLLWRADLMGQLKLDRKGRRYLDFDPTDAQLGKNCGIERTTVPAPPKGDTMMADIIAQAKATINKRVERAAKVEAEQKALTDTIGEDWTVDDYNGLVEKMQAEGGFGKEHWRVIYKSATARGFEWLKEAKVWNDPNAAEAANDIGEIVDDSVPY